MKKKVLFPVGSMCMISIVLLGVGYIYLRKYLQRAYLFSISRAGVLFFQSQWSSG